MTRSWIAAVAALAVATAGAGCGGSDTAGAGNAPAGSGPDAVETGDYFFKPATRTVEPGTKVIWTNAGKIPHNVIGDGEFRSRQLDPGDSYSHTFETAGTYAYLCTLHPTLMKGEIVVR